MKSDLLLIFDLDDTIFETKSIAQHQFSSIIDNFKITAQQYFKSNEIDLIIRDLWKYPFDHVSKKYQFDESLKSQFSNSVNSPEYRLSIQTFTDFSLIRSINVNKVLVTTGFKKLQLAKITALRLENEFEEIHIDEIDDQNRVYKRGIFEKLIKSGDRERHNLFVIGDNPNSELKSGRELGLTTVQVAKFEQPKSIYADYYITNFQSMIEILGKHGHNN